MMTQALSAPATDAVRIRTALAGDIEAILELEQVCFQTPHERFGRRQVRSLAASRNAYVVVAQTDGSIVGWAAGLTRRHAGGKVSGRIYAVAVHPQSRGLRIGQRLMEHVLVELGQRGADRVFLEVRWDNLAAICLYEKLGFTRVRIEENYYCPGMHALKMVKNGG